MPRIAEALEKGQHIYQMGDSGTALNDMTYVGQSAPFRILYV